MSELSIRIEELDTHLLVHLDGIIDESSDLDSIFSSINKDAVFDLRHVKRINSPGVLKWIKCFGKFTLGHRAFVESVSYPMAIQASCVANLFSGAEVRSCLAPFFCAECHRSYELVVSRAELGSGGEPPSQTCPTCKQTLDFDELDTYFLFLSEDAQRR